MLYHQSQTKYWNISQLYHLQSNNGPGLSHLLGEHRSIRTEEAVDLVTLRLTHVEHLAVGLHVSVDARELLLATVEVRVRHHTEHRVVHPRLPGYRPHLQALLCPAHHLLQGQPHPQRGQVGQLWVPQVVLSALLPGGELRSPLLWERQSRPLLLLGKPGPLRAGRQRAKQGGRAEDGGGEEVLVVPLRGAHELDGLDDLDICWSWRHSYRVHLTRPQWASSSSHSLSPRISRRWLGWRWKICWLPWWWQHQSSGLARPQPSCSHREISSEISWIPGLSVGRGTFWSSVWDKKHRVRMSWVLARNSQTFWRLNCFDPWIWLAVCCGNFVKILWFPRYYFYPVSQISPHLLLPAPGLPSGRVMPGRKASENVWAALNKIKDILIDARNEYISGLILICHIRDCCEEAKSGTLANCAVTVIFIIFNYKQSLKMINCQHHIPTLYLLGPCWEKLWRTLGTETTRL